jgi:hexosaminidase
VRPIFVHPNTLVVLGANHIGLRICFADFGYENSLKRMRLVTFVVHQVFSALALYSTLSLVGRSKRIHSSLRGAQKPSKMLFLLLLVAFTPVQALWPIPRTLSTGTSPLTIADGFSIDITAIRNLPLDLKEAVSRANRYLHEDKLGRLVVGRGPGNGLSLDSAPKLNKLSLKLNNLNGTAATVNVLLNYNFIELDTERPSMDVTEKARIPSISDITALPVEQRDESYRLKIPKDGSDAVLVANTTLGLLRGLTTFNQVWYQYDRWTYTVEVPFDIVDEPYYVRCGGR